MSDHPETTEFRCLCGANILETPAQSDLVAYCHCSHCRRATGSVVSVHAEFRQSDVTVRARSEGHYATSAHVTWRFCDRCGSRLAYEDNRLPGLVFLPVGLADRPELFEPSRHSHHDSRVAWFETADALPRHIGTAKPRPM